MPCYHPRPAWASRQLSASRRFGVTFRMAEGWKDKPLDIPCGKCIGCRLRRAQDWGNRVMHELRDHGPSGFITLTYSDEQLPENGSLHLEHLQLFWKRLRKHLDKPVRYFACGEYGDQTERPHYHAIAFGFWPDDRVKLQGRADRAVPIYRSPLLERLWPHGQSSITPVTREAAVYVAKYTLGKYDENGNARDFGKRAVPFLTMSLKPGIGHNYARENARALARFDGIRLRGGHLAALPRYYETVLSRYEPQLASGLKTRRVEKTRAALPSSLPELADAPSPAAREEVKKAHIRTMKREPMP